MRMLSVLSLSASIILSACTGSPATLASQPAFEVTTPTGLASVSIREAPSGMTLTEFEHAVSTGTRSVMPDSQQTTPATTQFPTRRIVWHVYPIPPAGTSRLVVNVFDGSVPFADAQQVIDNSAPRSTVVYAVRTLTERLSAELDRRDREALR